MDNREESFWQSRTWRNSIRWGIWPFGVILLIAALCFVGTIGVEMITHTPLPPDRFMAAGSLVVDNEGAELYQEFAQGDLMKSSFPDQEIMATISDDKSVVYVFSTSATSDEAITTVNAILDRLKALGARLDQNRKTLDNNLPTGGTPPGRILLVIKADSTLVRTIPPAEPLYFRDGSITAFLFLILGIVAFITMMNVIYRGKPLPGEPEVEDQPVVFPMSDTS